MSAFSDHLESAILESTLRGASFPTPSVLYVALYEGDPTDTGSGAPELSDSSYVRQDASKGEGIAAGWTSPTVSGEGQMCSNTKVVQFPPIADAAVTVTHFALFDAQNGGNMLYKGAFTTSKTLEVNDVMSVDIGAMQIVLR